MSQSTGVIADINEKVLTNKYGRTLYENRFAYLLLIPTLCFLLFIVWIPFLRGIWISFHDWPLAGDPTWVGLENYVHVLTWDAFHTSLRATVLYLSTVVIQLVLALVAALITTNLQRFRSFVDGVFILPYTLAPVVAGSMWLYVFQPNLGPVLNILVDAGLIDSTIYWQVDGTLALIAIILATGWQFWPFMYLIFVPALDSIPDEEYELGKVYGATRIKRFWHITLPHMRSAILIAVSIRVVWNLAKVSLPWQMTQGGPGYSTSILGVLIFREVTNKGRLGQAYVVGIVLVILSLVLVAVLIRQFEQIRGERV